MTQNALAVLAGVKISPLASQSKYAGQELGAGIATPFAVIGYKGARWSIRHRGATKVLERHDANGRPDGFVPFLDVVILFAASHHSKVYYAKSYQDGDDDVPDCWSTNGQVPDQAAPKKQSATCATCKWNEFGSRVNQATGSKGKACSDTRRMAVVPYLDIENVSLGGPMLLRVPPASLGSVGEYSDMLKANSAPYSAIATRIGFDPKEAYPRLVFEPIAALTDGEMARVLTMQAHPLVERIVQEQMENVSVQPPDQDKSNINSPVTQASPSANGNDPGPLPAHLDRTNGAAPVTPQVTPPPPAPPPAFNPFAQAAQASPPQATVAASPPPPAQTVAPPPAEILTAEQLRIRELEAKLAAAEAGGAAGKRPRKPRTPPVSPQATATGVGAAFTGGAPAKSAAQISAELVAAGAGTPIVPPEEGDEEDGSGSGAAATAPAGDPALASITARLSKILT